MTVRNVHVVHHGAVMGVNPTGHAKVINPFLKYGSLFFTFSKSFGIHCNRRNSTKSVEI